MAILTAPPLGDKVEPMRREFRETKVSRFSSVRDVHVPNTITLADFITEVRSDKHADLVAAIRREPDKEKRSRLKLKLPAATVSGVCGNGRGGDNAVTEHSGLMQLDFDDLDEPDLVTLKLERDRHVVAVFRSPSGDGVKAVAAIDPTDHEGCFRAAEKHFGEQELELDPSTKDVKRLCFLSHDSNAWIADREPVPFQPVPLELLEQDEPELQGAHCEVHELPDSAYGEAFVMRKDVAVGLNPLFFAKNFSREELLKFDPKLDKFYFYEASTGLWVPKTKARTRSLVCDSVLRCLDRENQTRLAHRANPHFQNAVVTQLMGDCESDFTHSRIDDYIHLANGMLDVSGEEFRLCDFSPEYLSRNQIPVGFDPEATCPRFENELLGMALGEEDLETVRLYFGQCLTGKNPTQTFLVVTGTPGGGKTQLLNVVKEIIGAQNTYELRIEHVMKQFEAFNWLDKTLLFAADAKGNFLEAKGVDVIKRLVGGDPMNAERKGGQEHIELTGDFNLIVTSNSRLKIDLDGDVGAWRRRLLIVNYDKSPPKKRIPNFGQLLVREEGSGILNFALEGLAKLRRSLDDGGRFPKNARQAERVDRLLEESESARAFVRDGITKSVGFEMTTHEVLDGYRKFCDSKGWSRDSDKKAQDQFKDLMIEFHGEVQQRKKSSNRYWKNVCLVPQ
jgi:P4 family phage/plasmid primase-like protien